MTDARTLIARWRKDRMAFRKEAILMENGKPFGEIWKYAWAGMKDKWPTAYRIAKNYQFEESFDDAENARLREKLTQHFQASYELYAELLEKGVAKEEARIVLPLSLYTEFYWGVNARALMNFLRLRAEAHAQLEIRVYAEAALEIFREKMPWTCEAFETHVLPKPPAEKPA